VRKIDWYFDFISPFAYLASESLQRLPDDVELNPCPVLFAGLLQHWQTKGPAEISPMRRFTFRHVQWLAGQHGITLKLPPRHPFNPLKLLRLCIALGNDTALAQQLFRFVWAEGRSSDDPQHWQELIIELGVDDVDERISSERVKAQLRENTEMAIQRDIFGVPSFALDGEVFWGFDSIDFLVDWLQDPSLLQSPSIRAADGLPEGQARKIQAGTGTSCAAKS